MGYRVAVVALLMVMMVSVVVADRVALERPINVVVILDAQTRLTGRITAWDAQGFDLTDADDAVHDVAWLKLTPERVYTIHEALLRNIDAPARAWLDLGVRLKTMDGGEACAEKAFIRAERLDGSLKAEADRARKGEPLDDPAPEAPLVVGENSGHDDAPDDAVTGIAAGPTIVGGVQHDNWGPQTPEKINDAIIRLKAFGEETRQKINGSLQLHETAFFICYTDLSPDESRRWAGDLDKMYNRLTDLFGIKRGENIWLGKCLIFIFRSSEDYHRFQTVMHQTPSGLSAGMCHGYGSGDVHIAFYRQPNEMQFAHVLVHESVHGFLHRYRSPVHIPTWINEGLAEVIAYELVPKATVVPSFQAAGQREMKVRGHTAGLFDANQLEPWQYGAASSLTTFMIRENKKGYVAFVNGIKDGQAWPESLEQNYGVKLAQLIRVFGNTQKINNLRP